MKTQNFVFTALAFMLFFYILFIGRDLFIPFTIAIIIWYLSHSISSFYTLIWPKKYMNRGVSFALTFMGILSVVGIISAIIWSLSSTVSQIVKELPQISLKAAEFIEKITSYLGVENIVSTEKIAGMLNMDQIFKTLTLNLTSAFSTLMLILVFALFLILEQGSFDKKLLKLFKAKGNQEKAKKFVRNIDNKIKKYFLLKTGISATTALIAYGIMEMIGLQFASFFAVLIFLLNFIPTIGSIAATAIPVLFALTQFTSMTPIIVLLVSLGATEVIIGNIIEPKIVGNSLNLSPLVIILSLIVWGKVWGIAGMFLCVPIMVSLNLFLSEFEETRRISVLLSRDGDLDS